MKISPLCLLLLGLALAANARPDEKAKMEDELAEDGAIETGLVKDDAEGKAEEENLEENEEEIEKNNADPKSDEKEKLYPFDDETSDEFAEKHEGLNDVGEDGVTRINVARKFSMGRIDPDPAQMRDYASEQFLATYKSGSYPASYDAEALGKVTSIKNQGSCGSCVAFGSTTTIETCLINAGSKTKDEVDLAEQYFVDCAYGKNWASGCNGAATHSYHEYIENASQGGTREMPAETSVPYKAAKESCTNPSMFHTGSRVAASYYTYSCDEDMMARLVSTFGSVTTAVHASQSGFQNYASGVANQCVADSVVKLDHVVTVVGYGEDNGVKFWKVKNSWGSNWGQNGYIKIARKSNFMCGIGKECAISVCEKADGNSPPPPPPPTPAPGSGCDITNFCNAYWGGHVFNGGLTINGEYSYNCVANVCTPQAPTTLSACELLCGGATC